MRLRTLFILAVMGVSFCFGLIPASGALAYRLEIYVAPLECVVDTVTNGTVTQVILSPQECYNYLNPPEGPVDNPGGPLPQPSGETPPASTASTPQPRSVPGYVPLLPTTQGLNPGRTPSSSGSDEPTQPGGPDQPAGQAGEGSSGNMSWLLGLFGLLVVGMVLALARRTFRRRA